MSSLRNKFSVSYGLVVKTLDNQVVIIKRIIPYCVQTYLMEKKKRANKEDFEKVVFPTLNLTTKLDYLNFKHHLDFEDKYDFPHGQMSGSPGRANKYRQFMTAFREFREEAGYTFQYSKFKINNLPTTKIEFKGLDGFIYVQYFFLLTVDKLVKCKPSQLEDYHTSHLVNISLAKKLLENQQLIKGDNKHLLL